MRGVYYHPLTDDIYMYDGVSLMETWTGGFWMNDDFLTSFVYLGEL